MFDSWDDEVMELWDRFEVDYRELPTLQMLLVHCNGDVLETMVKTQYMKSSQRLALGSDSAFSAYFKNALQEMRDMDLFCRPYENDWILLPLESFKVDSSRESLVRRIGAPRILVRMQDQSTCGFGVRSLCEYESVPWEQVLSYRVWMGGALCVKERYMMLASAIWQMIGSEVQLLFFTLPLPEIGFDGLSCELSKEDPWGLSVEADFNRRYGESLDNMADWLNEKAWEKFCEERSFFVEAVLRTDLLEERCA